MVGEEIEIDGKSSPFFFLFFFLRSSPLRETKGMSSPFFPPDLLVGKMRDFTSTRTSSSLSFFLNGLPDKKAFRDPGAAERSLYVFPQTMDTQEARVS